MTPYIRPGIIELATPVTIDELCGVDLKNNKSRKQETVVPRQVAIALTYVFSDLSLSKVGVKYGKDHSTVVSCLQAMNRAVISKDKLVLDILITAFRELHSAHLFSQMTSDLLDLKQQNTLRIVEERLNHYEFCKRLAG